MVGDLVGNSQHRPALGPTRQQTVSRHLPSHASPHLPSVLLCASVFQTPSLLGAQTRLLNTEPQRSQSCDVQQPPGSPPTNPFLPGSVVRRPVSSGFPIPRGVCLMVRLEQVWRERIRWLQSSGLTIAAGSSQLAKDRRVRRPRRRRRLFLLLLFESGAKNNPQDLLVHRSESRLTVVNQAAGLNPAPPAARLRAARRRSPVCK